MPEPPETDWDVVARNPEFRALLAAKARFIIPATLFFVAYYFALPVLVGYAPQFMSTPSHAPPWSSRAPKPSVSRRVAVFMR